MFYRGKKCLFYHFFMECHSIQFTTISINVERGIVKILFKYRYFQDLLIDIDINIDKAIPKISISISISIWWFWKISISISISIRQFCKISISIKYRIDSNLAYRTGLRHAEHPYDDENDNVRLHGGKVLDWFPVVYLCLNVISVFP